MTSLIPIIAMMSFGAQSTAIQLPRHATVAASVANSEWVRAGEVSLDLRTGRYTLRHRPSRLAPKAPIRITRARLRTRELAPLRAAYLAAHANGLVEPNCTNSDIIVGNGGTHYLDLTADETTVWVNSLQRCWTEAATNLDRLLEVTFAWRAVPER